ncbi:hypothetical protein ES708_34974 [subsurface metagenome]
MTHVAVVIEAGQIHCLRLALAIGDLDAVEGAGRLPPASLGEEIGYPGHGSGTVDGGFSHRAGDADLYFPNAVESAFGLVYGVDLFDEGQDFVCAFLNGKGLHDDRTDLWNHQLACRRDGGLDKIGICPDDGDQKYIAGPDDIGLGIDGPLEGRARHLDFIGRDGGDGPGYPCSIRRTALAPCRLK